MASSSNQTTPLGQDGSSSSAKPFSSTLSSPDNDGTGPGKRKRKRSRNCKTGQPSNESQLTDIMNRYIINIYNERQLTDNISKFCSAGRAAFIIKESAKSLKNLFKELDKKQGYDSGSSIPYRELHVPFTCVHDTLKIVIIAIKMLRSGRKRKCFKDLLLSKEQILPVRNTLLEFRPYSCVRGFGQFLSLHFNNAIPDQVKPDFDIAVDIILTVAQFLRAAPADGVGSASSTERSTVVAANPSNPPVVAANPSNPPHSPLPCETPGSLSSEVQCVADNGIPMAPKFTAKSPKNLKRIAINKTMQKSEVILIDEDDDNVLASGSSVTDPENSTILSLSEGPAQLNNIVTADMDGTDFTAYMIQVNKTEISLEEAINRLRHNLEKLAPFSVKEFVNENTDVIVAIFGFCISDTKLPFSLNDVCMRVVASTNDNDKSSIIPLGKMKKLFKTTYRRNQIEQIHPQLSALKESVDNAVNALEPGEDAECLWDNAIAASFKELISSKHQNICIMMTNQRHQKEWIEKFIKSLLHKKNLWPEGTMSYDFLKSKACEISSISNLFMEFMEGIPRVKGIESVAIPVLPTTEMDSLIEEIRAQNCEVVNFHGDPVTALKVNQGKSMDFYIRNRLDLDNPELKRTRRKESRYNRDRHVEDELRTPRTRSERRVSSQRRSSRHRSDESQYGDHYDGRDERSTRRSKRHSNESHSERSSKRARHEHSSLFKEKTDFDKKLESFVVWDPLRSVVDKPVTDVFLTKEASTDKSSRPKGKEPVKRSEKKGADQAAVVPEGAAKTDSAVEVNKTQQDSGRKQSEVLQETYGSLTISVEEKESDLVTVSITIQGYFFEGFAQTQSEALEDASYKAMLLAPYLLQTV